MSKLVFVSCVGKCEAVSLEAGLEREGREPNPAAAVPSLAEGDVGECDRVNELSREKEKLDPCLERLAGSWRLEAGI